MTSHAGRLYALAASLLAFFVLWAVVAAQPWSPAKAADPRLAALARREQRLRYEARLVRRVVARRYADYRRRYAAYRRALARQRSRAAARAAAAAAALAPAPSPSVRIVTLPPLTITRSS